MSRPRLLVVFSVFALLLFLSCDQQELTVPAPDEVPGLSDLAGPVDLWGDVLGTLPAGIPPTSAKPTTPTGPTARCVSWR